jgi:hypothetical protein
MQFSLVFVQILHTHTHTHTHTQKHADKRTLTKILGL